MPQGGSTRAQGEERGAEIEFDLFASGYLSYSVSERSESAEKVQPRMGARTIH